LRLVKDACLLAKVSSPAPNEIVPGPTARRVVENVARLRKYRGYTREQLSERLGDVGRPIRATGLARLESGRRRVDADDLVALALALDVSPPRLLLPGRDEHDEHPDAAVALTDEITAAWDRAWRWAVGEAPLSGSLNRFLAENRPFDPRLHELPPGASARIEALEATVRALHAVLEAKVPGGIAALIAPDEAESRG
jgi:transcriptional regulator with XRE-family HTH domain